MPYKSDAQRKWAHTQEGTKALGGKEAVHEWDQATKGKSLPEHVKKDPPGDPKGDTKHMDPRKMKDEVKAERLKNLLKMMYDMMSAEDKAKMENESQSEAGAEMGNPVAEETSERPSEHAKEFEQFFNKRPTRSIPEKLTQRLDAGKPVPVAHEETLVMAVPKKKPFGRK